ncbi:MAG TPA: hypothetical protein VFQ71_11800 [Gaiellales bacterium]|nr:hypothetical protein [Gaiellales bacterium]
MAYVGGGSTRAPGTAGCFARREDLAGSEIVLIDLDPERLGVVRRIAQRIADARGLEMTFTATTDRRAGLAGCDAVLTSYRPGGFEMRVLDERMPLQFGVAGQETHGPGGFFMALRSLAVMREIVADMEAVCPGARLFNYTNPVNVLAQAVSSFTDVPVASFCDGPIGYPRLAAELAGLDPGRLETASIGLNHASWSIHHTYDGADAIPLLVDGWRERRHDQSVWPEGRRMMELIEPAGSIPSLYFQYYYFHEEVLAEQRGKPTTRAEDIIRESPRYWAHYVEQAAAEEPQLDPARSREGIEELELAIVAMAAVFNDGRAEMPLNVPNNGAVPGFPDDLVVEAPGVVSGEGPRLLPQPGLPRHLRGLVESLAEFQVLAADAGWNGGRRDAERALAAHPLVLSFEKARAIYAAMAAAQADYLPQRLRV